MKGNAHNSELKQWLLDNADSDDADVILREMLDGIPDDGAAGDAERAFETFRNRVDRKNRISRILKWTFRTAAIIAFPLVFVFAGMLLWNREPDWNEIYTLAGETKVVVLPDSSVLYLDPCSKVVYPDKFSKQSRHIFLSGEAYADIAPDRKSPFIITAGEIEIKVLGTEFNISSYMDASESEVALVEGSVEVYTREGRNPGCFLMHPGEMIRYDKERDTTVLRTFAPDYFKNLEVNGGFQFIDRKFCDIACCLERTFGVKIYFEDDSVMEERYFASFINDETVDDILNSLNIGNQLKITRKGNVIHISENHI